MAHEPGNSPRWTPEQLLGITTTGRSLLVSAAAGSGKTAVLAERCAHLVCDANPPCGVDELLVVTFTENAAAEMKSRIEHALRQRFAARPSAHLARQLAIIEHAQVSTLHGFCSRILRQQFHLLGLDPSFIILDGDEAGLLRSEIAQELFLDRYERDESGEFHRLIDSYGDGDDQRLIQKVIRTHETLCSVIDPAAWRRHARLRIVRAIDLPLESSELGKELIAMVGGRLANLRDRCASAIDGITRMGGFPKYVDQLRELSAVLGEWDSILRTSGLDALSEAIGDLQLPALPRMPSNTPGKELAQARIDSVKKELKDGPLLETLRFSSSEWREGLRQILPCADVFLGLVQEFSERYAKAKSAARSLDFADLERFTLQVLRDTTSDAPAPSATARQYHRQFQHVLVDEYQDINEVQDAILQLVSRECLCPATDVVPNLFCVGDVKQSIYRFRLAEPGLFLNRSQRFGRAVPGNHGLVIDLQANFRSRAPLLDALNGVFERLMSADAAEIDYDQSHRLRPGIEYPSGGEHCFAGAPVELHLLPNKLDSVGAATEGEGEGAAESDFERAEIEAMFLARRIHELMGHSGSPAMQVMEKDSAGVLQPRAIRYRDVVILLRSLRHKAEQYADILRQSGIPVHSDNSTGYFDSTEVRDMLALLSILDNQRQDIPLAAVLRSPLANLAMPEDAMARIHLAYRNDRSRKETISVPVLSVQTNGDQTNGDVNSFVPAVSAEMAPVPFHQAVVRYATEQDDELAAKLRDFLRDLGRWREMAHRRPLAELIWAIYEQTGYLAFCSGLEDGPQRCANLIDLYERARQFGTFQRQGVYRFLRFLQSLQSESDLGQPSVASQAEDVVRIMSIHRAKGLEFPVVLLPDLGKRFNLQDCGGAILVDRHAYLGMSVVDEVRRIRYPSLASKMVQERLLRQSLAEELRVLYVAMTRAKEHLILVGTCKDTAVDVWKDRWSAHQGPLPADTVLAGRCMLDWLGPVAAAMACAGREHIRLTPHTAEEIATWPAPESLRPRFSPEQASLAQLMPLSPPPPSHPAADEVIRRLAYTYPYQPFTTLQAAQSVTALAKPAHPVSVGDAADTATGSTTPSTETGATIPVTALPQPRCLLADTSISTVDRGTATHLVLQYLDFARPGTPMALAMQVNELVTRKLIAPAHAAAVDFGALEWLMAGEIGDMFRACGPALRRELAFYSATTPDLVASATPSTDPYDQVMVRGRIDALVPHPDGSILMDYKTDHVAPAAVAARAEFYRPQVSLYRQAIEKITSHPVQAVYLIFLTPRVIWRM